MNLGVQYYRAPFPEDRFWNDDLAKIRDSGLSTVQLWVLWSWVEAVPGKFQFDDYDRLVDLAGQKGLNVILSTIAEMHPYWIHREVPGSEMVDHMDHKVVSSNRVEVHFGLTPGGCTDHPGVWERMTNFLQTTVTRYRSAKNILGWDAWNELRWNVQADGLVCFCDHTIKAFRNWLDQKYGGLDGLNKAWKRRYGNWEEVWPGKLPDRPYTEMMAFEHFLTWRSNKHGKARYDLIKKLDPNRPVTVHADQPCVFAGGGAEDQPLNRGNDWVYADDLDGVGCSSFPKWFGIDDADFGIRVEGVKSAARNKLVWLSEVQGGRAAKGFEIYQPVDPPPQQRWIWNGIAGGVDTILFWCWRDEVFGRESAGYGIAGNDGLADQRLAAMKKTGKLIEQHKDLITHYRPSEPQVGIFFSPQSYYIGWADEKDAGRFVRAVHGYARSMVRRSIPFKFVEEYHLDELKGLKILFMPRSIVTDEQTEKKLAEFVRNGGTLVCESECGAFNSQGLYRYPEDRFIPKLCGYKEGGRRNLETAQVDLTLDGKTYTLGANQWLTPWHKGGGESSLLTVVPAEKGNVVLCGTYLGDSYLKDRSMVFEDFVEHLVRNAGWKPEIEVLSPLPMPNHFVYIKYGESNGKKLVFVFFPENADTSQLKFRKDVFKNSTATLRDLITDRQVKLTNTTNEPTCTVETSEWRLAVLTEE